MLLDLIPIYEIIIISSPISWENNFKSYVLAKLNFIQDFDVSFNDKLCLW